MRKLILIALVFIPVFVFGQVQQDEHVGDVIINGNINVLNTDTDIDSSQIPYLVMDSASLGGQKIVYAAGDSLADIDTVRKLVDESVIDVGWTLEGFNLRPNGYSINNGNNGGDIVWLNSSAIRFGSPPYSITTFDVSTSGLIELRAPYEGISIGTSGVASYTSDVSASFTGLSLVNKDYADANYSGSVYPLDSSIIQKHFLVGTERSFEADPGDPWELPSDSSGFVVNNIPNGRDLTFSAFSEDLTQYSYLNINPTNYYYELYATDISSIFNISENAGSTTSISRDNNNNSNTAQLSLSTDATGLGRIDMYAGTTPSSTRYRFERDGITLFNYVSTGWTDNNLITKGFADSLYDHAKQYEIFAQEGVDSTITTNLTTDWTFLGAGENNKFTNTDIEGFFFDSDTLLFDGNTWDLRDSIEFHINYGSESACSNVNRTIYTGIFIKHEGETEYTEYTPCTRRARTTTANIYWPGPNCPIAPIWLKKGDKIQIRAKCLATTTTLSTQSFIIYLFEE